MLRAYGKALSDDSNVFDNATALNRQKVAPNNTHGAAVRKEFGTDGAVVEAKNGSKIAKYAAMDLLLSENPLRKFFGIMSETEDSGVLFHGRKKTLDFVR